MNRYVLITGATGFIGRNLARKLSDNGRSIILLVRDKNIVDQNNFKSNVRIVNTMGDLSELLTSLGSSELEGIIHLASQYKKDHFPSDISSLIDSNITFGSQLLEAATHFDASWFVNVGSIWQHFLNSEARAVNFYAATKNAFDTILDYYADASGLKAISLYIGDTYGPDDDRSKILNLWREAGIHGKPLQMTAGHQAINLLHVDDVVSGIIHIAEMASKDDLALGQRSKFCLGPEKMMSLREIAYIFSKETGFNPVLKWGAIPYRPREVMQPEVPFLFPPGWQPRIPLDRGIREAFL